MTQYCFSYLVTKRNHKLQKGKVFAESVSQAQKIIATSKDVDDIKITKYIDIKDLYINPNHIIDLFQGLQTTCATSTNTLEALKILLSTENIPETKALVEFAAQEIIKGKKLYEILSMLHKSFPTSLCMIIKSGEESGNLIQSIKIVSDIISQQQATKNKITKILIYPALLTCATFGLSIFVLTSVVPNIADSIPIDFDACPATSIFVFWLSKTICSNPLWSLFTVMSFIFIIYKKSTSIKNAILSIGVLQSIILYYDLSICFNIIYILTTSNTSLIQSFSQAKDITNNKDVANWMQETAIQLQTGNFKIKEDSSIPSFVVSLLNSGIRSGKIEETCRVISLKLENNANTKLDYITVLAGPLAIMVIGGVLGSLILSVMIPMTSIKF